MKWLIPFLLVSFVAHAATIHVATTGNNTTGDGSIGNPYLTVQKAVDVAAAGDTILIAPGVYPERVTTKPTATSGGRITINGQGVATVNQVYFEHPYWSLINTTIKSTQAPNSRVVYLQRGADYTVISNCVINPESQDAVTAVQYQFPSTKPFGNAAAYSLLVSNTITGVLGSTGVSMSGDFHEMRGNRIHDLGQADFMRLWGRSNWIVGNTFSNIFQVPGIGNHIDFIQTFTDTGFGSIGHVIENNIVTDVTGGQLTQLSNKNLLEECGYWVFRNNLFMDVTSQASISIPGIKFHNNTFVRCNSAGFALNFNARTFALGISYAHNSEVLNNVFFDCGDGSDNKGWYAFTSLYLTNCVADYNFVANAAFEPKRAGTVPIGTTDEEGVGTWDSYRFAEPNGINGGDPLFVNAATRDFRISTGSFLIDAGANGITTNDFFGTPRPLGAAADIGYFESDGEPPETPDPVDPPDGPDPEDPAPEPEPPGQLSAISAQTFNVGRIIKTP